jgi:hypothetical protein
VRSARRKSRAVRLNVAVLSGDDPAVLAPHVRPWVIRSSIVACLLLPCTPCFGAEVQVTPVARQHFNAGVALLRDPDGARYEEAYREFKAAYQASPSWKILGNLGICAMKLERDGEAIEAFTSYLAEGKNEIDASERADIERDLSTLKAQAAEVTLTTAEPDPVDLSDERAPVQGSPINNRYQLRDGAIKLLIHPGHHVITAQVSGKSPVRYEVDVDPGAKLSYQLNFDSTPATTPTTAVPPHPAPTERGSGAARRPVPAGVWIGAATTGALAIAAGVTGVLAVGKHGEYKDVNGSDADKAKSLRDETKTLNLVTDVLIGAAVISAGITTYIYIRRPERKDRDSALIDLKLSPRIGLQQSGLALEGVFR